MTTRAGPGECYWHTLLWSRHQIGIYLHLWSVFPGTLIAILQFVPAIRTRKPRIHRFLGYVCWVLAMSAAVTALMIVDHAFGGTTSTIASSIFLAATCFVGHYKAYKAIKAYRIDEHRAWMMRTWVYMGGILTMRPLMPLIALIITFLGRSGVLMAIRLPCPQVFYMLTTGHDIGNPNGKPDFFSTYGFDCSPGVNNMNSASTVFTATSSSPVNGFKSILTSAVSTIPANLISKRIEFRAAALDLSFGPALIIGVTINVILVEWYLSRTKDEAHRLRKLGIIKKRLAEQKMVAAGNRDAVEETMKKSICLPEVESLRGNILHL